MNKWRYIKLRRLGVIVTDYRHTHISGDVTIGKNTVIEPYTYIADTEIGSSCTIKSFTVLEGSEVRDNSIIETAVKAYDTEIGSSCTIKSFTVLEGSTVRDNSAVGPFAHVRDNSVIGNHCRVGNFVEIKNSKLDDGTKAAHLSYIGDAEIGKACNVGAGVVFCNYDGKRKHKTVVGDRSFIGSNSTLIAPIDIGSQCFIAADSVIGQSLENNSFAVGIRQLKIKPNRLFAPSNSDKTDTTETKPNKANNLKPDKAKLNKIKPGKPNKHNLKPNKAVIDNTSTDKAKSTETKPNKHNLKPNKADHLRISDESAPDKPKSSRATDNLKPDKPKFSRSTALSDGEAPEAKHKSEEVRADGDLL